MSHLGAFGNLKEMALRPGPGAYDAAVPNSILGGRFGQAKRALTQDSAVTTNQQTAINKERAFQQKVLAAEERDALDDLVETQSPQKFTSPQRQAPAHDAYLKRLDTMPRLLNANVFPSCGMGFPRASLQQGVQAQAWRLPRERLDKLHYHAPNEVRNRHCQTCP